MSFYNDLTEDQQRSLTQVGHKVQRYFSGTTPSVGLGYPDLYLELFIKTDSKTKLINPANVWSGDVKIVVAPFSTGLSASTGLVFVGGSLNTVTGEAQFTSRKAGIRERLQEE